jgi:hypothetical protein
VFAGLAKGWWLWESDWDGRERDRISAAMAPIAAVPHQ